MTRVDYRKELSSLYKARAGTPVAIDVPEMRFLVIDGEGAPESAAFARAIEALYPVAYTLKFMSKKSPDGVDYGVMPLEGLWWAKDMRDFTGGRKDHWQWTLMIMQPDVITPLMVEDAVASVRAKKNPPGLPDVRFERFREGRALQVLHVGPFAEEGPAIAALHDQIAASGFELAGKHHEIYLSDFRRTAPARLRTILRQPFRDRGA